MRWSDLLALHFAFCILHSAFNRVCLPLLLQQSRSFLLAFPLLVINLRATAAELDPAVSAWLAAQTNIQSWSADFVQTRSLKSLTQPLTNTGHVWFAAPSQFRWELRQPSQTIAVCGTKELQVIYPRLKRAERYPLAGEHAGPWHDALALLEAGFPRSEVDLLKQYNITSQTVTGETVTLVLEPKSASAKRMIPQFEIIFDTKDHSLRSTELEFADGSKMRNDFKNPVLNPRIESDLFAPQIPGDYKVVEPLKSR